jgi:hypothetical protein
MRVAAWQIVDDTPQRLVKGSVGLEAKLESWIARDPALISEGLTIVAKQAVLAPTCRADLLAVDAAGRWVVVEIKAGPLLRETVAQGLDYASILANAPSGALKKLAEDYFAKLGKPLPVSFEGMLDEPPREVEIMLVGTAADEGLERLADYLARFALPIRSVTFQVLDVGGVPLLMREVVEADIAEAPKTTPLSVAAVLERAEPPIREAMQTISDAAERNGLFLRPYKNSVMVTPPMDHARTLITVWNGGTVRKIFVSAEKFEQFYGLSPTRTAEVFGPLDDEGCRPLESVAAQEVATALDALMAELAEHQKDDAASGADPAPASHAS